MQTLKVKFNDIKNLSYAEMRQLAKAAGVKMEKGKTKKADYVEALEQAYFEIYKSQVAAKAAKGGYEGLIDADLLMEDLQNGVSVKDAAQILIDPDNVEVTKTETVLVKDLKVGDKFSFKSIKSQCTVIALNEEGHIQVENPAGKQWWLRTKQMEKEVLAEA